jgi:hypothetical protein
VVHPIGYRLRTNHVEGRQWALGYNRGPCAAKARQ